MSSITKIIFEISTEESPDERCRVISKVDVGDLHVTLDLQHVNLIAGPKAVSKVKQVLPIYEHLKPLLSTTNRHLRSKNKKQRGDPTICLHCNIRYKSV